MTERAKRAAEELRRRGWQVDEPDDEGTLDKECQCCGTQIDGDSRYCKHCGSRVEVGVADGALADLEAAITAALMMPNVPSDRLA